MSAYARLTVRMDGRTRTLRLRIVSETPTRLAGWIVDSGGDEVLNRGRQQLVIVAPGDIVRRTDLIEDYFYGGLVSSRQESQQSRALRAGDPADLPAPDRRTYDGDNQADTSADRPCFRPRPEASNRP